MSNLFQDINERLTEAELRIRKARYLNNNPTPKNREKIVRILYEVGLILSKVERLRYNRRKKMLNVD